MTREEAIKVLNGILYLNYRNFWDEECDGAINMAIETLQDRPKSEWIDVNGDGSLWRCDQCKDTACCRGNFCPNCGANMKSEVI